MNALRRLVFPCLVLLAEVLFFYRHILFSRKFAIPWDLREYHLPLLSFVSRSLRQGEWPLWDPYTYCGFPFYTNVQAQAFYPPAILTALLGNLRPCNRLVDALEWQVAGHIWLGGVFCYFLLRKLDAGIPSALFGATIFQLGGFFTSQVQHVGAVCAAAWLPLAWLCLISLYEQFSWRWTALLAFSLAMAILSGFPAVTAVVFVSCGLLIGVLLLLRRANWKLAAAFAGACAFAALLCAVQLAPTLELLPWSIASRRAEFFGAGGGMSFKGLVSLVIPNYYSVLSETGYDLELERTFLYLYCGITGLLLGLAGAFRGHGPYRRVFALMTLLSGLWMLGASTPVGGTIFPLLPTIIRSSLYAEFAMAAFVLGLAILAALGAHSLIERQSRALAWLLVPIAACDLTLVASGSVFNRIPVEQDPSVSCDQFEGSEETLARMRALVRASQPPARLETFLDSRRWASNATLTEVPTPHGNDPLALARYLQVRRSYATGEPWYNYLETTALDSPIINLLNVGFVVSYAPEGKPPDLDPARFPRFVMLPGHQVYRNTGMLPRFFLVSDVRSVRNWEEGIALLRSPDFVHSRMAVVEGHAGFSQSGAGPPTHSIRVIEYRPQKIALEIESSGPAFLVSSETYYPGWRAAVAGRPQEIFLTNVAFRGFPLPGGRHTVTMEFDPPVFRYSVAASAVAWAMLLWIFVFNGVRPRALLNGDRRLVR